MMFKLFNSAGSTGRVFLTRGGSPRDMGLAYSGIIGPMTTVAVVPTTPQVLSFEVTVRTEDNQGLSVVGSLTAVFVPANAVKSFDFTVNPKDGTYKMPWNRDLQAMVVEEVLSPIRNAVKALPIEEAISAHTEIANAIKQALTTSGNRLAQKGITLDSYSVTSLDPTDDDLLESIGAEEREELLSNADAATHERQKKAASNARELKQYDVETALEVEKKRAILIEEQIKNKEKEATADAEATRLRLAPLRDMPAGTLIGASLMKFAETNNRVGVLNIGPEILTAIGQK